MLSLVLVCVLLEPAAPGASAVYAGVVARDSSSSTLATRVSETLQAALQAQGVLVATSGAQSDDATQDQDGGHGLYLDGNFAGALEKADRLIRIFEAEPSLNDPPEWANAVVVRALALQRLGRAEDADATLAKLASVLPDVAPDPAVAPPKLLERHAQILADLQQKPRVRIDVQTDPAGAQVLVDGVARGSAPLAVDGLLSGFHIVGIEGGRARSVEVPTGSAKVVLLDAKAALERLRTTIAAPAAMTAIVNEARGLHDDVIVGALATSAGAPVLVVARAAGGACRTVGMVLAGADLKPEAAQKLAAALKSGADGWVGPGLDVTPERILSAAQDAEAADEGGPWLLMGLGAGIAVAAVAAVAVVFVVAENQRALEVAVDASQL